MDILPLIPNTFLVQLLTTNASYFFYALDGLILVTLLGFSALISGSEIALFSLSQEETENLRSSEYVADRLSAKLLDSPRELLATILIFNNLVNVSFVTIATYLTWDIVGTKKPSGEVLFFLTVVVTIFVLFFGEVLPKVYAGQQGVSFLRVSIYVINFAYYFFQPLSFLLVSTSSVVEKRIKKRGYKLQIEELPQLIDDIPLDENTSKKDKEILKGIVNFGNISVKEIMTPKAKLTVISNKTTFEELLNIIQISKYSRIPVCANDDLDKIEGVLYVKDVVPHMKSQNFKWQTLLKERYYVPTLKKIDKLLKEFQAKRVHMAIVVDEFGRTAGVATMEDILEEIVGEIDDETDDEVAPMHMNLDENTYLFEGKAELDYLYEILNIPADYFKDMAKDSHTIAGLILEIFGKVPEITEEIQYGKLIFSVTKRTAKIIKIVKIKVIQEKDKEKSKED